MIEDTNNLKCDFVRLITNEIRNPLTVILGNAALLTDPKNMPGSVEIAEIAGDIEEEGWSLLKITNDIMAFSSIESGMMQIHPEELYASLVTEEIAETIKPLANKKGIRLEIKTEDIKIKADPAIMKQILLNLLINAVNSSKGSEINVRLFSDNNMARFEIRDRNSGICEDDIPYILNVFRHAEKPFTHMATSIGLGLTIAKRLIEMHGGGISVKSKLNKESIVSFTIPLSEQE